MCENPSTRADKTSEQRDRCHRRTGSVDRGVSRVDPIIEPSSRPVAVGRPLLVELGVSVILALMTRKWGVWITLIAAMATYGCAASEGIPIGTGGVGGDAGMAGAGGMGGAAGMGGGVDPCATDGDCDDGNDCTVNSCVAGECVSENAPNGDVCFCSVCGAAGMCMSGECVVTPDPQTVRVQLTCPTTIGLNVNVGVEFTVSPDDQYRQGEATSTTVDLVATQQALPVSLPAQISEAEWSVAVGGASPTAIDNTVIYDPPLEIDAGENNELDGGSSTANVTPSASEVTYELGSIGIVVVVGGNPLPVTCDVPAGGDQAVFPVDN